MECQPHQLATLERLSTIDLVEQRYQRLMSFGSFKEND